MGPCGPLNYMNLLEKNHLFLGLFKGCLGLFNLSVRLFKGLGVKRLGFTTSLWGFVRA